MQFNDLVSEMKNNALDALRMDCDNYFEAVVLKDELDKLAKGLEGFFGLPVWPSKNRLSFKVQETIRGFGGIMPGQTLYFRNEGSDIVFAMLWPWQDGERTTVKIIKK